MPGIQYSQLMAFLALFAGMVIIGCDRSLDVDMTNISGAWTANFNDLELIVVFGADGSYEMYADDRSASSVQQGGMGLLVISSEIDELIGLCDRILVMARGEIRGTYKPSQGREEIMRAAL